MSLHPNPNSHAAGDTRRADEIDVNEADPSFDSIETRVSAAADEREANALRQFAQLGSIQTKVLFATPIVFVLGLSLVAFFSGVLRSYRRGAAEAMRREATATGDRERRFRSLIQNTSDVIVICTAAGTITYQSPAAEAGWGFATDELLDQAFLTLLHPDGRPALGGREVWAGRDQGAHGHGPRKYFGATAPGGFKRTLPVAVATWAQSTEKARSPCPLGRMQNRWYYTK